MSDTFTFDPSPAMAPLGSASPWDSCSSSSWDETMLRRWWFVRNAHMLRKSDGTLLDEDDSDPLATLRDRVAMPNGTICAYDVAILYEILMRAYVLSLHVVRSYSSYERWTAMEPYELLDRIRYYAGTDPYSTRSVTTHVGTESVGRLDVGHSYGDWMKLLAKCKAICYYMLSDNDGILDPDFDGSGEPVAYPYSFGPAVSTWNWSYRGAVHEKLSFSASFDNLEWPDDPPFRSVASVKRDTGLSVRPYQAKFRDPSMDSYDWDSGDSGDGDAVFSATVPVNVEWMDASDSEATVSFSGYPIVPLLSGSSWRRTACDLHSFPWVLNAVAADESEDEHTAQYYTTSVAPSSGCVSTLPAGPRTLGFLASVPFAGPCGYDESAPDLMTSYGLPDLSNLREDLVSTVKALHVNPYAPCDLFLARRRPYMQGPDWRSSDRYFDPLYPTMYGGINYIGFGTNGYLNSPQTAWADLRWLVDVVGLLGTTRHVFSRVYANVSKSASYSLSSRHVTRHVGEYQGESAPDDFSTCYDDSEPFSGTSSTVLTGVFRATGDGTATYDGGSCSVRNVSDRNEAYLMPLYAWIREANAKSGSGSAHNVHESKSLIKGGDEDRGWTGTETLTHDHTYSWNWSLSSSISDARIVAGSNPTWANGHVKYRRIGKRQSSVPEVLSEDSFDMSGSGDCDGYFPEHMLPFVSSAVAYALVSVSAYSYKNMTLSSESGRVSNTADLSTMVSSLSDITHSQTGRWYEDLKLVRIAEGPSLAVSYDPYSEISSTGFSAGDPMYDTWLDGEYYTGQAIENGTANEVHDYTQYTPTHTYSGTLTHTDMPTVRVSATRPFVVVKWDLMSFRYDCPSFFDESSSS